MRYLLIGAGGKTGNSYAKLLQQHGHHVLWYDHNPTLAPKGLDAQLLSHVPHDSLDFDRLCSQFDVVTLTPGVPLRHPFIQKARAHGIPVITEVAYCAPYLKDFTIIGITGTDGKSTTTTIVAQLLRALGKPALECGNFGTPLSEIVLSLPRYMGQVLACELSSYQLEEPGELALAAGIFLNLAADHLDRYSSIEEYGLAKWNMLKLLRGKNPLVVNSSLLPGATPYWKDHHPLAAQAVPVLAVDTALLRGVNFAVEDHTLIFIPKMQRFSLADCALKGRHNYANLLFALEAIHAVFPELRWEELERAIGKLKPLPHRFETITNPRYPGIVFINDSKATTTQAAMTALANAAAPVFVLLGGRSKGENYQALAQALLAKKARAFVYGECRTIMADDFRKAGFTDFAIVPNLEDALQSALAAIQEVGAKTATVLLSPAATSWDRFRSFEERGDFFRALVQKL
ncbi:MAG: UDP-N-acetylmuramoyl-L-alanine--D-glutamate ligase [Leptospiraceae bacterium]|nr:UDP-N-acetylmuramoyl-L-alanine--D-glutamate ligase [Leptospiraceae bacterium]